MTTTITPTQTSTPSRTNSPKTPVWRVGAAAGLVAAIATTLVAVAAKAVDIPMMAAPKTAEVGQAIPTSGYAMGTLVCTAIGIVLAVVLARRAKHPATTFVVVTTVLTVLSMAGPITTGFATTATRLVLALTHVVAAAIVIPALAHRLSQEPARR